LLFIVSTAVLPDGAWLAFSLSWGLVLLVTAASGFTYGFVLKRSLVALPFAAAAIAMVFSLPGRTLFSVQLGGWELTASDTGLVRFVSVLLRSWLSVQMAILLTATTPFPDLMHALRHLRVPPLLVAIISFMFRYLSVLVEEVTRLLRARQARSARLEPGKGGGSIAWRARVAGNMAGQLFLRSLERSDRVYNAMLARGFQGQFVTLNPHVMQPRDWRLSGLALLLLAILQVIGRVGR